MAGRGTDILLGGNPKGLTQALLENKLLDALAPGGQGSRREAARACIACWASPPRGGCARAVSLPGPLPPPFLHPAQLFMLMLVKRNPASPLSPACAGAPDADAFLPECPLANLAPTFLSDADMAAELPPPLWALYRDLQAQLRMLQPTAGGAAAPAGSGASPSGAPPAQLPWHGRGPTAGKHAARDAVAWLGQQLEGAEVQKAQLRWASGCAGHRWGQPERACVLPAGTCVHRASRPACCPRTALPSLRLHECLAEERWWEEAERRVAAAQQAQQQEQRAGSGAQAAALRRLEATLRRFCLLQWLWFDRQCAQYAAAVGLVREGRAWEGLSLACLLVALVTNTPAPTCLPACLPAPLPSPLAGARRRRAARHCGLPAGHAAQRAAAAGAVWQARLGCRVAGAGPRTCDATPAACVFCCMSPAACCACCACRTPSLRLPLLAPSVAQAGRPRRHPPGAVLR